MNETPNLSEIQVLLVTSLMPTQSVFIAQRTMLSKPCTSTLNFHISSDSVYRSDLNSFLKPREHLHMRKRDHKFITVPCVFSFKLSSTQLSPGGICMSEILPVSLPVLIIVFGASVY